MAVRRPTAAVGWARDPEDKQPFVYRGCLSSGSLAHQPREARHRHASVFLPFSLSPVSPSREPSRPIASDREGARFD